MAPLISSKLTKTGTLIIEADNVKPDGGEWSSNNVSALKRGTRFCGIEQARIAFGIDFPGENNPFGVDVIGEQSTLSPDDGLLDS